MFAVSVAFIGAGRAEAAEGLASWYESDPANAGEFAAAHNTLPIGTRLTVSYGGRWVIVTVTDRGAGVGGRELDISQAAAEHLGLTEVGVDYVEYTYAGEGGYGMDGYGVDETSAPQASQAGAGGYAADEYYTVQPGDTLYSVASLYGVSVESLAAANGMGEWDMLYSGQAISIPQGDGAVDGASSSPGYPGAAWYPASDYGNYTAASRPASNPVDKIVVHTTQGSYDSALGWFQDPASGVSAHYTVRSSDGAVGQSVSEMNIAHHAGNWDYNQTSVGIEHEGFVSDPSSYTDTMYRSSAQLGAHLVNKYSIPVDRQHVVGHDEVPGATHTDPGAYWDWDLYLSYIQQYAGGSSASAAPGSAAPGW